MTEAHVRETSWRPSGGELPQLLVPDWLSFVYTKPESASYLRRGSISLK
jgi:hypothetical protein